MIISFWPQEAGRDKHKTIPTSMILEHQQNILTKICTGVFFKVENQGVCMIGKRK